MYRYIIVFVAAGSITHNAVADVTRGDPDLEITDIYQDLDEWLADAPDVTVIDFTGWPEGTQITDQYADLGVVFTNGFHWINNIGSSVDGWVLTNNIVFATITMEFDQPFNVIGTVFPGTLRYDLFLDGEYVGWTNVTGGEAVASSPV